MDKIQLNSINIKSNKFVVFVPICMHAASTLEGSDKDTSG